MKRNEPNAALFTRTLRLKVRPESYAWLNAAALEVNSVWNFANERASTALGNLGKWLSGFDLNHQTSGATEYMKYIGADTIQRVNGEYAAKRNAVRKQRLRWRVSRGAHRSLGWVPFKAASLKRKGHALRFAGKTFRLFEWERLDGVKWRQGCFAQDALEAARFYRGAEQKIAQAQRRGHKRQAKRLHRKAARRRADALHKFSRKIVDQYQKIVVGDASAPKLARTRDVNAARNILRRAEVSASVSGNESCDSLVPPRDKRKRRREAGAETARHAA